MPLIGLTCSYADSGVSGLTPVGIFIGKTYSEPGVAASRLAALADLLCQAEKEGCTHVFDVKFESWSEGHPNNGNYGSRATGDGYRPGRPTLTGEPRTVVQGRLD